MKKWILIVASILASNVHAADDGWKTDRTTVIDGIEYLQQSYKLGNKTTYQLRMSRFVGDVSRLPVRYFNIGDYSLTFYPLSEIEGSAKTLYLNVDTITMITKWEDIRYLWECKVETIVFPPEREIVFNCSKDLSYVYTHSLFRDCVGLKRVVFGAVPKLIVYSDTYKTQYQTADETIRDALWRVEEFYYPKKYQEEWERILKTIPCKCKYGAFEGEEWTGLDCVIPGSGNLAEVGVSETPSVVTNVVTYYASVTNVHVHYVSTGEQPTFLNPPTTETGYVNVITEINGGFVSIPESWADNYDGFKEKFGEDFSIALAKPTGKHDQQGNPLFVWQDYVAGTNPVDENDVFRATVTIDGDKVIVSYSPKLDTEREAMRKYTIWGKKSLMEKDWIAVQEGGEANYNFFKVSVEMKPDSSSNQ